MPPQYDNIPQLLKSHPNWVAWGIRSAPPKSPYNPASLLSGRLSPAKAGIRETWSSYHLAAECVKRRLARGIGYEFDGSVYGIDLDHVIYDGEITPEAQEIVGKLDSYTEISPSGSGLHIYVFAPGANITRHRKKDCFLEIYNTGRYFTVTGNIYGDTKSIETRTSELQAIHDECLLTDTQRPSAMPRLPPTDNATREHMLQTGLERDKVFKSLWLGQRRIGNESADDIALMNKLAYWCSADPSAMIIAFLSSPYHLQKDEPHKMKCRRPDYLTNTARNACATVRSTAAADRERWQRNRNRGYGLSSGIPR